MSTTPEPANPEPTPRSDVAAETTDTAKPPVDETETEAAESPETSQVDEASTSRDEADDSPTEAQDRSESDPDSDTDSETESAAADDSKSASDAEADSKDEGDSDEDRQRAAEEFAAEHDPANHDIAAGEEFRQPGDWTAEDGGPQVWDSEGNLSSEDDKDEGKDNAKDNDSESESDAADAQDQPSADSSGNGGRRVSELEEVRDGGYSVGSAATIHDGAMPFGHPVKAWEDTKTFVTEDHDHYEEAEPHVWFADAEAAQRAGFQPAD
ncbi:hypothetical protein [Pedococcus bigeumensis]|uniref:Uncharacterized protein n=1 Tax=Pedococcus bigeumensis TaxID=433644 RepID=A0A502CWZ9_9MICO|nr:hypothetical protein [Pedococcus bigeumensis]TPG17184.1 hypothetical protein EAH86_10500 [Pedococcus bigeumensis]